MIFRKVALEIPDEIASLLSAGGQDHSRIVLEAVAVDGYRRSILTQVQVGQLLGLSRIECEDFLSQHIDLYDYDPGDLHREAQFWQTFPRRTNPAKSFIVGSYAVVVCDCGKCYGSADEVVLRGMDVRLRLR